MLAVITPHKLPLLESLCWNIADPYKLAPKVILDIYLSRWHYRNLASGNAAPGAAYSTLGASPTDISEEELAYINKLTQNFKYAAPILEMNQNKNQLFSTVGVVIDSLNTEVFDRFNLLWCGGSMLAAQSNNYRLSLDIDFIANKADYNLFYEWMLDNQPSNLLNNTSLTTGEVRRDRFGVKFPVVCNNTAIKLEIIAEERFILDTPPSVPSQISKLVFEDRIVSKLFANRDRWIDDSSYCRDLIDLAVLRTQKTFPNSVFTKGKRNYKIKESLIEAIKRFQSQPKLRKECYEVLQINNRVAIIDGIDLLADDYSLPKTNREFIEIDFSYLVKSNQILGKKQSKPKQVFEPTKLEDIVDRLPYREKPKTTEQMNAAIESEIRKKWH